MLTVVSQVSAVLASCFIIAGLNLEVMWLAGVAKHVNFSCLLISPGPVNRRGVKWPSNTSTIEYERRCSSCSVMCFTSTTGTMRPKYNYLKKTTL